MNTRNFITISKRASRSNGYAHIALGECVEFAFAFLDQKKRIAINFFLIDQETQTQTQSPIASVIRALKRRTLDPRSSLRAGFFKYFHNMNILLFAAQK